MAIRRPMFTKTLDALELPPDPACPKWLRWTGRRPSMRLLDPLDHGPLVYYRAFGKRIYFVNHPELAAEILFERVADFPKSTSLINNLTPVIGQGLLISGGALWKQQRKLMAFAFAPKLIASQTKRWTQIVSDHLDNIDYSRPVDVGALMAELAMALVTAALFGVDLDEHAQQVTHAMDVIQDEIGQFRLLSLFRLPLWMVKPHSKRFRVQLQTLDRIIDELITRKRQMGFGEDLLSVMLAHLDQGQLSPRQLRDELVTLLLAGHETTATALTWTCYLLAQNQDWQNKCRTELGLTSDIDQLQQTRMVLEESLRIYPPAYVFTREAAENLTFAGAIIPAGSILTIMPYILHRHPDYWPEPEKFNPLRFGDIKNRPDRGAYLPFGDGQRICIGRSFAYLEAKIVLAGLIGRYQFVLVDNKPVPADPAISLRPAEQIWLKLAPVPPAQSLLQP